MSDSSDETKMPLLDEIQRLRQRISDLESMVAGQQENEELLRIGWLLRSDVKPTEIPPRPYNPPYGDLVALNTCREIVDAVGLDLLRDITSDYLDLLGTSSAVYEKNGDYAYGIFSSGWCQLLDAASRKRCDTDDDAEALSCGKWLCHESCWTNAAKVAIETGEVVDVECHGGLRLYAAPIWANGEVVGAIDFGYGNPPREEEKLQEIADKYRLNVQELREQAEAYQSRPPVVIDLAKKRLHSSARMIGTIVERRQAEEALKASEKRIRTIVDSSPFPVAVADTQDDKILYWSSSAVKLLGHTAPTTAEWYEIAYPDPDYRREVIARWKPLLKEIRNSAHAVNTGEYEVACADGSIRTCELYAAFVDDQLVVTFNDITDRKRAEAALRKSEANWRVSIENMLEGYALHEPIFDESGRMVDFRYLEFNPAAQKIVGISHEEIIGKTALEVFPHIAKRGLLDRYAQVVATGEPDFIEDFYYSGDKLDQAFDISCYRVDEACFVCVFRDVTDRKRNEEAIQDSESRFRRAVTGAPFPIMLHAEGGEVLMISDEWTALTGYTPDEVQTTDTWAEKAYGEKKTSAKKTIDELYAIGESVDEGEWTIRTKSGEHIIWDFSSAPLGPLPDGRRLVISMAMDITERKRAENMRDQLNAQLETKNKELEQVVYVASHDLRSPLVNIDGYGRELEEAFKELRRAFDGDKTPTEAIEAVATLLEEDIPDALRFIRTSASKMDQLLSGLLKLSRSGRAALAIKSLDMNAMMTKVVESMEFQVNEVAAEIEVSELPPCMGDPVQVNQVFSNLLENALRYRDPKRPLTIQVSGRLDEERTVYCVEDNGIGIAPAHQQNIFEVFHRLAPAEGRGEGLGLTIVRQALGRLSGTIWVESSLGEGSRFFVALPNG